MLFWNLTDPFLTGRHELSMPKICCDIDVERSSKSLHMQASWRRTKFASIHVTDLDNDDNRSSAAGGEQENKLVYKFIPRVGEMGKTGCGCAVVIPHSAESKRASQPSILR